MNKIFKTLSVLTIASFAASLTACGESSTASDSDNNEIFAEQELSDDEELAEISSSSKKSKATSSSEEDETLDSEEEFVDSEDENVVSSSSEKESTDEEKVASSSSEEKISSDSKKEKSGKFSGKVSGVSQKGPFILGSKVTLYEIEGVSLNPSGNSFISKIKNDKGEFDMSFKDLSSKYALLIADGYYRNEVSGKNSASSIKLKALSNLTNRNTVNVNILTHLEYNRVKYLITSKGVEYSKAKAQAEKEILEAFGISFKEGSSAEDLSIVGSTENDGALLALSVLMQGTSAEAAFSERLSLVAQDLEEDGTIDDKQILADIADEVALIDLSKVRKNIEGWKLSSTIPDFENYVESYWLKNYGLEACTDENITKTSKNSNKLSKTYEKKHVCDERGWRVMTDDEVKYGTCAANEEGKRFEKSRICDGGEWRSLTADESMGACTKEKIGETAVEGNELSENFEKMHVCDEGGWRKASEIEVNLNKVCTEKQHGTAEGDFICLENGWNKAKEDLKGLNCEEGKTVNGVVSGVPYICENMEFHRVSSFQTWFGTSGSSKLNNNYNSDAQWLVESDGQSHVEWPVTITDNNSENQLNAVVQKCDGICGKAILNNSEIEYDPYVYIAFELTKKETNVSDMGGICIAYTSNIFSYIDMIIENTLDYPSYTLKKSPDEVNIVNIPWSSFKQSGWGEKVTPEEIFKSAIKIGFKLQHRNGTEADFNIKAIGPYMGDCDQYDKAK